MRERKKITERSRYIRPTNSFPIFPIRASARNIFARGKPVPGRGFQEREPGEKPCLPLSGIFGRMRGGGGVGVGRRGRKEGGNGHELLKHVISVSAVRGRAISRYLTTHQRLRIGLTGLEGVAEGPRGPSIAAHHLSTLHVLGGKGRGSLSSR